MFKIVRVNFNFIWNLAYLNCPFKYCFSMSNAYTNNVLTNNGATSGWYISDSSLRRCHSAENLPPVEYADLISQNAQPLSQTSQQYFPVNLDQRCIQTIQKYSCGVHPFRVSNDAQTPQTCASGSMSWWNYMKRSHSADSVSNITARHSKILKFLSKRYWENVATSNESKPGFEFLLMSYNVLAQDLVDEHPYLYRQHKQNDLKWGNRWKNIYNEINTVKPDVMCLQEVQESHLANYYNKFEKLGYKKLYKKRTGQRTDGCAIFYLFDKLKLVEYETVEFLQPGVDILNRDNVAIVAKFSPLQHPANEFIVATTHLLYNPKRQDVRLAQTQLLVAEIERLSFARKNNQDEDYLPIIITGDFNSTPDSAVYEFITKGMLKYNHLSKKTLDDSKPDCHGNILVPRELQITDNSQHAALLTKRNDNELSRTDEVALIKLHNSDRTIKKVTKGVGHPELFCSGTISHLFAFKSVYEHGEGDNIEGTTFQNKWISVDFIFYSGKKQVDNVEDHKLELLSRYRLPRTSEFGSVKLPNALLGSDHLSLTAKFKLNL